MKLDTHRVDIQSTIRFDETITMKLDDGAAAMILNNLISMYSNPYLAALREYTSNAYDSHIEAGQTRPVQVVLPTAFSPNLIIRDFGVGMSKAQLVQYSQFGVSSKRDTNDQIGGFGIGSKSGLAMAPQFTVTAVKDGKRNTVIVSRREDGHPVMGMLAEQDVDPSEPNGVTITIPATNPRVFLNAIRENDMFLGWPLDSIEFAGEDKPLSVYDTNHFADLDGMGWRAIGETAHYSTSNWVGRALVGPVLYTIKWSEIQFDYPDKLRRDFLSSVVLKLDNGSVDLTPSREELLYSKRTRAAIRERFDAIIAEARKEYEATVEAAPTKREALKAVRKAQSAGFDGAYMYKGDLAEVPAFDPLVGKEWLTVMRATETDTGFRAAGGGVLLRNFSANEINSVLNREHVVLVVDAGDTESIRNKSTKHLVAATSTTFIRGRMLKLGHSIYSVSVAFTTLKADELHPWFMGAFSEVISVEAYTAEAEASRKSFQAAARARRALENPTPRRTEPLVRLVHYRKEGNSYYEEDLLSTLDTARKYVIFQVDDPTLEFKEAVRYNTIRGALMTRSGWNEASELARQLTDILGRSEFGILLANKTWKVKKYEGVIQTVSLREALTETINSQAISLTPLERAAAKDQDNQHHRWVNWFPVGSRDKLKSSETRAWMQAMENPDLLTRFITIHRLARAAKHFELEIAPLNTNTEPDIESPGKRYPLLAYVGANAQDAKDEVRQYIDMMDALDTQDAS